MDHWSKFHILFPLERKTAVLVAEGLEKNVFAVFGTPKILHHDNEREFVNQIVTETVKSWPGETAIITGRPRHPQSQGMVEQGNAVVKRLLGNRIMDWRAERAETCAGDDDTDVPWAKWLMRIQCKCVCVCVCVCVRACVRACVRVI